MHICAYSFVQQLCTAASLTVLYGARSEGDRSDERLMKAGKPAKKTLQGQPYSPATLRRLGCFFLKHPQITLLR